MENTDMYTKKISYLTTTDFYKQSLDLYDVFRAA